MLKLIQIYTKGFDSNFSYIIYNSKSKEAVVVDPCGDYDKIDKSIAENSLRLLYIINTHSHFDHVEGNNYFKIKYGADIIAYKYSKEKPDIYIANNDTLSIGKEKIKIIHTPGHTADSISLLFNNSIVTGDLVFPSSLGRTDLESGSDLKIKASFGRLLRMDDSVMVYPGHDYGKKKMAVKDIKKAFLKF